MSDLVFDTSYMGHKCICLEETDSTNEVIKRLISDGVTVEGGGSSGQLIEGHPGEGLVVTAKTQTGGKGRRGRVWESPKNTSLAFSALLKPKVAPDRISMVTLVAAMAVATALRDDYELDARIKWPNDIVVNGRKICGILTELDSSTGENNVIVGIGVNVNQTDFAEEIAATATSIAAQKDDEVEITAVLESILKRLEHYYDMFNESGDLSDIRDEYNELLVSLNGEVKVLNPLGEFTGISEGIDEMGNLLVRDEQGEIQKVNSGEVSVRGIYGYV